MKKLETILDKAFDLILYLLIAISFIGSGILIILEVIQGFHTNSNLIETGVLIVIGMTLSYFLYWIKSHSQ